MSVETKENVAYVFSWLGSLQATGSERLSWLNGLMTSDLAALAPNQGSYGLITNKVGRVLSDALVLVGSERVVLGVLAQQVEKLVQHFDHYLVMEDAELTLPPTLVWLFLHGPQAWEFAQAQPLFDGLMAPLDWTQTGGGVVVALPDSQHSSWLKALHQAEFFVGDEIAWERFRLRHAVPRFGLDFDETTYPQEASLEHRAVNFQKGCYLGQEVVCRLEMRGRIRRKLVALQLETSSPPRPGTPVFSVDQHQVGTLTSAVAQSDGGGCWAMAMVALANTQAGTSLVVENQKAYIVTSP